MPNYTLASIELGMRGAIFMALSATVLRDVIAGHQFVPSLYRGETDPELPLGKPRTAGVILLLLMLTREVGLRAGGDGDPCECSICEVW